MAIILMPMSRRAGVNSLAFAGGWIAGVAGALAVVVVASGAIGTGTNAAPSPGTSTVHLILGVGVVLLGVRNCRRRPAPGQPADVARWLQAIEEITPVRSAGLGVALSAVNPKNLLLIMAGGLAIAGASVSSGGKVVAGVVFVLLAVSTVVAPVVLYRVFGARARRWLSRWLELNHTTAMAVLLLVIGVVLIGKGIGGF